MSLESVRAWLAEHAPDLPLIEVEESTATVETAAKALGVEPGRIAKTLAVCVGEETFLLVTRGDARLDNGKTKQEFGGRPRMLGAEDGRQVRGGVGRHGASILSSRGADARVGCGGPSANSKGCTSTVAV